MLTAFLWWVTIAIAFNAGVLVGWVGKKAFQRWIDTGSTCSNKDCFCTHNVVSVRAGDPGQPDFMWCEDCGHRI